MTMTNPQPTAFESDSRFPSGPWTGFWLQKAIPGRHLMELRLHFHNGTMTGEGRDWVGAFIIRGRYDVADGRCHWNKRYIGKHDVFYKGFNEGKGIWGTWEMSTSVHPTSYTGGFHIWPEGMADPTQPALGEAAEPPVEEFEPQGTPGELERVGVG
ncbi:MAG TPA: hypothetical protein VE988_17065 [Gemmataceae bacterium]|nr:hypothetical protein [Gemmataceae bacterium]